MLELVTDTRLDLALSAARFGEGLFETIRIQNGRPRWLNYHLERLSAGCAFLGLDEPPALDVVADFVGRKTPAASLSRGVLRLVAVDRKLITWAEPILEEIPSSLSLGLSQRLVRYSPHPLGRFKTLSYAENRLLQREAVQRGLGEVIAPNEQGRLTDSARFTLFVVLEGKLWTPPLADGPLPGVGRRILLTEGLAEERSLTWEDLAAAPALALVNALRGLIPIHAAEGHGSKNIVHPLLFPSRILLA